ncbi:MAG: hypothetical protein R2788_17040 [Saprospiraceae bacterium]
MLFAFLTVGQCLFFNTFLSAQIIYVNQTAIGNADGSSWENAFTDLQDGLLQAQIGDSVWVATGTYFPTNTDNREVSFVLKNGVKLFGGFSGTEMSLGERDWLAYPTVLSGDIGTPGDSTDNTYTILYMEGVDSTTQADGVFFISATADGDGGADSPTTCGGAVYINGVDAEAVPKIWNCNFERNYAKNDGGAVFVNGRANGSVAPQFYRCNFVGNKAGVAGGAIARIGGSWTETKKDFWECNFESNTASQFGGAIYYLESERLDTIELTGCNFIGNKSGLKGGGLLFDGGRITGSSIILDGCLFEKNSFNLSGGINFFNSNSQRIKYVMIRNCEFKDDLNSLIEAADNTGGPTELSIESTKFSNGYFSFRGDNNSTILNINHVEVSDGNSGTLWLAAFKEININDLKFIGVQDGFGSNLIVLVNSGRVKCTNSLFVNNDVLANEGIWLRNNLFGPYGVTDTLIGCVFKNQVFSNPVDGIALANLYIANSIIVDDPSHGNLLAFNVDTLKIENSLITSAECPSFSPDPASNFFPPHFICGEGVVFGTDPMFLDTAAGDFRLHPCSPARNAGDNGIVNQLGLLTDIGGGPRVLEGTVDMGAG